MRVDDIESKVIEVLMLEEDDKTVREISNATNVKQNALRKCLDMMLKKGTLSRNKVGQSWRWRINQVEIVSCTTARRTLLGTHTSPASPWRKCVLAVWALEPPTRR